MTDFSFPKENRLCSLKQISKIFKEGDVVYSNNFKVLYIKSGHLNSRVVISVPKRNIKLAVQRNRIKRVSRESLRLLKIATYFPEGLDLFFIYSSATVQEYSTINKSIVDAIAKIDKNLKKRVSPTTNSSG